MFDSNICTYTLYFCCRNEFLSRLENTTNYQTIYANKWRNITNIDSTGTRTTSSNRNIFNSLEHIATASTSIAMQELRKEPVLPRPKSICTNEELLSAMPSTKTIHSRRNLTKRCPVKRAASRLYHASYDPGKVESNRGCIGPEFVVRAALHCKQLNLAELKVTKNLYVRDCLRMQLFFYPFIYSHHIYLCVYYHFQNIVLFNNNNKKLACTFWWIVFSFPYLLLFFSLNLQLVTMTNKSLSFNFILVHLKNLFDFRRTVPSFVG